MSAINGRVEATHSKTFATFAEADAFTDWVIKTYGLYAFEGYQVRPDGYIVNYYGGQEQ